MVEHIVTFTNLENEDIVNPKDKLNWKIQDNREGKYKIDKDRRRFIFKTEKKLNNFIHPGILPEDSWL